MNSGRADRYAIGVDVGGTGIKAAVVEVDTGQLVSERFRVDTPRPATPDAVHGSISGLLDELGGGLPVGIAFPAVIQGGQFRAAANLDPSWIGTRVDDVFGGLAGSRAYLNDADAAGVAEARFGAARGVDGLVVMVTLGTGIGTALIYDGCLIPNAELGHLEIDGVVAESRASARSRKAEGLTWEEWALRVSNYLQVLERLMTPDLFVIGGGVSRKPDAWFPLLAPRTPVRLAHLASNAGIVGAALRVSPSEVSA